MVESIFSITFFAFLITIFQLSSFGGFWQSLAAPLSEIFLPGFFLSSASLIVSWHARSAFGLIVRILRSLRSLQTAAAFACAKDSTLHAMIWIGEAYGRLTEKKIICMAGAEAKEQTL